MWHQAHCQKCHKLFCTWYRGNLFFRLILAEGGCRQVNASCCCEALRAIATPFILWQIFFWKDVYLKILSQIPHVRFSIMLESELLTPARVGRTGLTRKMGYFGMRFLGSEFALVGLNVDFLFHGEPKRKRFGLRWVKSHQSFCVSRFNSSVFSTHQSCCSGAEIWVQLTTCWWGYPLRASGS